MFLSYVPQLDERDCGAACLSMILKTYKTKISLQYLRDIAHTNINGTTAFGLKKCLEQFNFNVSAIQTDKTIWHDKNLHLPVIAHVIVNNEFSHFVVVYAKKNHTLLIADPGKGKYKSSIDDFSNIWTGVLVIATPNENYKPVKQTVPKITSFLPRILKEKRIVTLILVISLILTGLGIGGSYYFQELIDTLIPTQNLTMLNLISIAVLSLYLIKSVLEALRSFILNRFGQKITIDLMTQYLHHVLYLPLDFFKTRKSGEIMSRFLDANKVVETLINATLTFTLDAGMVLIIGAFLFLQHRFLFLVTIICLPFYAVSILLFSKFFSKANKAMMASEAEVDSSIIESLKGIETIKSYGAESFAFNSIKTKFLDLMNKTLRVTNTNTIQSFLKESIQVGSNTIILWIGANLVITGTITVGQLITYNALLGFFTNSLDNILNLQSKIQEACVANERLNEIFQVKEEALIENDSSYVPSKYSISAHNVSFSYDELNPVLRDINFEVYQGQKISIIGESGSGKSTLAKLLVNFYHAQTGAIKINGTSIEQYSNTTLRSKVTYVPQTSFFFSGSVRENLQFGLDRIPSEEELWATCKFVELEDYIKNQPLGLDSVIDEGAENLSGGQKQRLSLARALLRHSDTLILDEITSGMDALLADRIVEKLLTLNSTTIIFIAHQLSIVKKCNRIAVIHQGSIAEYGTHDELKNHHGIYESLYKTIA